MKRFSAIVLGICACLSPAGCASGDSAAGEWIDLRLFAEEFVRNALAAFLV